MEFKHFVKRIPLLGMAAQYFYSNVLRAKKRFNGSREYWEKRYAEGGNSGDGSYNKLSEFKAEYINYFVKKHGIESIIEYGAGDGNQLILAEYPSYTGFDVSPSAIERCRLIFANDPRKRFKLVDEYQGECADLTLSLDVIYHLIEDDAYESHMRKLFASATRFVIIYSSNATDSDFSNRSPHVKHRIFTEWAKANAQEWTLIEHKKNKYPYVPYDNAAGSFADFYVYALLVVDS
jgi:hypothetical protein